MATVNSDGDDPVVATAEGRSLGTRPVSVRLSPPASGVGPLREAIDGERRVMIIVSGVRADSSPGTGYRVFVGVPGRIDPDPDGPDFVGHVNFFGAIGDEAYINDQVGGDHLGHTGQGLSFSFDVTDLVRRLGAAGTLPDPTAGLEVLLAPAPVYLPAVEDRWTPALPEGLDVANARFDRIDLTTDRDDTR